MLALAALTALATPALWVRRISRTNLDLEAADFRPFPGQTWAGNPPQDDRLETWCRMHSRLVGYQWVYGPAESLEESLLKCRRSFILRRLVPKVGPQIPSLVLQRRLPPNQPWRLHLGPFYDGECSHYSPHGRPAGPLPRPGRAPPPLVVFSVCPP